MCALLLPQTLPFNPFHPDYLHILLQNYTLFSTETNKGWIMELFSKKNPHWIQFLFEYCFWLWFENTTASVNKELLFFNLHLFNYSITKIYLGLQKRYFLKIINQNCLPCICCGNKFCRNWLTCTLFVALRFISRHALAAAWRIVPGAVRLTEVGRAVLYGGVRNAASFLLHDGRHLGPWRRVGEDGQTDNHRLAHDVVDSDAQQGGAGALVVKGEVHTAAGDGHTAHLHVSDGVIDVFERLVGRHHVHVTIGVRVPGRHHGVSEVRLRFVIVQFERLPALVEIFWVGEHLTCTHCEPHLYVQSIRVSASYVRCSQPIVYIV